MPPRTKTLIPLTEADRIELVVLIAESPEPVTAAQAARLPFAGRKTTPVEVLPLLEDSTGRGDLFPWPPKTKQGAVRYWHHSLRSVAGDAIINAAKASEVPLAPRDITRALKTSVKLTEDQILPILAEIVAKGALQVFPPATARGKERYWTRNKREYAEMCLQKLLDSKGPQSLANLKKAVKWMDASEFQGVVDTLIGELRIWRHPPLGKVKHDQFGLQPPHPAPYLKDIESQLTKTIQMLKAASVPVKDLRRAVFQMVADAGVDPGPANTKSPGVSVEDREFSSVDLIALMQRLEPGAARGALVGTRDLRRAASLEKSAFDAAVLSLSRQGRLSLHRHDFAASLNSQERDELVADGQGNYYVGVALRQGSA